MKRYKFIERTVMRPHPKVSFEGKHLMEDPNGEWVRHEDVSKAINEASETGYFTGQNSQKLAMEFKSESVKCNCDKMFKEYYVDSWMCPAHGYKKR